MYKEGSSYETDLTYVKMFGNSNTRYVVMRDGSGVELTWVTSDKTKTFQEFRRRSRYKFRVKTIFKDYITISHLKVVQ